MAGQRNARIDRVRPYWHDIEALIKHHVGYAVCTYLHLHTYHLIELSLKPLRHTISYVITMCE